MTNIGTSGVVRSSQCSTNIHTALPKQKRSILKNRSFSLWYRFFVRESRHCMHQSCCPDSFLISHDILSFPFRFLAALRPFSSLLRALWVLLHPVLLLETVYFGNRSHPVLDRPLLPYHCRCRRSSSPAEGLQQPIEGRRVRSPFHLSDASSASTSFVRRRKRT
jgi:hypothetical protein